MPAQKKLSRRESLATGARYRAGLGVGFAMPIVITSKSLGDPATVPASDRIALGTIGCGGQDVVQTSLQAGKNTILMKVLNEADPWEFCLRLTDRQEKPIDTSKLTP